MQHGVRIVSENQSRQLRDLDRPYLHPGGPCLELIEDLLVSAFENIGRVYSVGLENRIRKFLSIRLFYEDVGEAAQLGNQVVIRVIPAGQLHPVRHGLRRLDEQHLRSIRRRVPGGAEVREPCGLKPRTLDGLELRFHKKARNIFQFFEFNCHSIHPFCRHQAAPRFFSVLNTNCLNASIP